MQARRCLRALPDRQVLPANELLPTWGELQWVLHMSISGYRRRHTLTLSQEQYAKNLVQKFAPPSSVLKEYNSPLDEEVTPLSYERAVIRPWL